MGVVIRYCSSVCPHHDQLTMGEVNNIDHAQDDHQTYGRKQQESNAVSVLIEQAYEVAEAHERTLWSRLFLLSEHLKEWIFVRDVLLKFRVAH